MENLKTAESDAYKYAQQICLEKKEELYVRVSTFFLYIYLHFQFLIFFLNNV